VFNVPVRPEIEYESDAHFLNCLNCGTETLVWQLDGEIIENASGITLDAEFDGITQNGDYQLISTNSVGCSIASDTLTVVQPHIAVSAPSGCIPFSVYVINTTDFLPGMTCSLNTGTSIVENFEGLEIVTFQQEGTYTPSLTCTFGTASGSASDTITAYDLEIPILSINEEIDAVVCENYQSFTEFIWNVDGVVINGGISQPTGNSVYQLQAYNEAGCGGSNLFIAIGTDEVEQNPLQAFPNPANDFFMIQSTKPCSVRVLNGMSQVVFESTSTSNNHQISTSLWPSGFYLLQWMEEDILQTIKFEVQH
jgi:PKD repeat protein